MSYQVSLEGKSALISGAGAGIGLATAEAYAELGARVALVDNDAKKIDPLRESFKSKGADALVIHADVTKADQVNALMKQVEEKFGGLDILVNNVGHHLAIIKTIDDTTEEEIYALYHVNLHHMFLMSKAALPLMRRSGKGGSIINLSSVEGFRGCPSNVGYTMFKHGVTGFTRSLAIELSADNIRVNTIAPESTDSEQVPVAQMFRPDIVEDAKRSIPLGRFGRPSDSAGAAVFLASDLSVWMTGSTVHVDGGTLAAGGFQRLPNGGWSIHPIVTDSAHPPFGFVVLPRLRQKPYRSSPGREIDG